MTHFISLVTFQAVVSSFYNPITQISMQSLNLKALFSGYTYANLIKLSSLPKVRFQDFI